LLEIGMMTPASSYVRAQRARARALAEAQAAMADHNVLVAPGSAIVAPKIGGGRIFDSQEQAVDVIEAILRFTSGFDATGQPALAIPTGLSPEGLPVGMQIVGRPFGEVEVLQVAAAYERARAAIPPPPEIQ
jgi:aspartyl-tRNA(Asn)/glutamyl-tRNA(Gln) amidotransferase subunit A